VPRHRGATQAVGANDQTASKTSDSLDGCGARAAANNERSRVIVVA
jgi:hypothetical protein